MCIRRNNIFFILLFILVISISSITAGYKTINQKLNIFFSTFYQPSFDSLNNNENVFFRTDISFKLDKMINGYENLFQTSDYNDGLRIEFNGKNVYLLFSDIEGKLFGILISADIQLNQIYKLRVTYINHKIYIILNGKNIINDFTNAYPKFNNIKEKSGQMRLQVKGNDYFSVKPEVGMEFKYVQPMAVRTNLSVGLTAAYENEIGKLQERNQARVGHTTAGWYNLEKEKEDRRGNGKFDLNIGVDNTRFGVTVNAGYDTKGNNVRGGIGFRAIY